MSTRRQLRCELAIYARWDNLAFVDEFRIAIDDKYEASAAYFSPTRRNGTLAVYQEGYASTYHDQHQNLERLNAQGYTIAALNHASYGDNACESKANVYCHVAWGTFNAPLPMRMHFSPIVAAINHALQDRAIDRVAMIGMSAGAWVTAVYAALDTRIVLSISVAGVMPKALARGNEWPKAQRYEPLVSIASFPDLFTLAIDSPSRRQVQIFNQYDRCCYSGLRPQLFADDLRAHIGNLTGGDFQVMIDDTHPRHKISRHAYRRIQMELKRLGKRE